MSGRNRRREDGLDRRRPGRSRGALVALLAGATLVLGAPGLATAVSFGLVDDNAAVTVDPDSQDGVSGWTVSGLTHLRQQWYWVRVGNGAETSLDQLNRTNTVLSDTNGSGNDDTFFAAFADPQGRYTAELRVVLEGGPFGSPATGAVADLDTQLTLTNTSGGALDLTLFQYTDIDLFNTFADDVLDASGSPINTVRVTDSSGLGGYEAVFTPGADAFEAAIFGPLLGSLNDGAPTALSGATGAAGDVTHAIAWTLSLVDGAAFILSQDQSIAVDPVPEPALLGLFLMAALCAGTQRAREGA